MNGVIIYKIDSQCCCRCLSKTRKRELLIESESFSGFKNFKNTTADTDLNILAILFFSSLAIVDSIIRIMYGLWIQLYTYVSHLVFFYSGVTLPMTNSNLRGDLNKISFMKQLNRKPLKIITFEWTTTTTTPPPVAQTINE